MAQIFESISELSGKLETKGNIKPRISQDIGLVQ
jgi:hypothetical protein